MNSERQVIFICSGNICRSPMAEALLASRSSPHRHSFAVDSAGTLGIEDHAANPDAVTAAAEVALDLQDHRSRGISHELLEDAFAIVLMGPEHESAILSRHPGFEDSLVRLWEYCPAGRDAGEIEDPLGRGLAEFRRIRDVIGEALDHWLSSIETS